MRTTQSRLGSAVLLLFVLIGASSLYPTPAIAQAPPPALTVSPTPPPANQPFAATFHIFASPAAFGILGWDGQANIQVTGNTIDVIFDGGCGWICPGSLGYVGFPFTMPALSAGRYRVRFVSYGEPPSEAYAAFDLDVGTTGVPAWSDAATFGLAGTLAVVALLRRRRIFPSHSDSRLSWPK